jgi:Cu/Ag efflux protein CusF
MHNAEKRNAKNSCSHLAVTLGLGSAAIAQSLLVAGQVIRVDQSAKKITIKHGPVPRLDIEEGMTIVYAAPDSNMLKTVKIGDKVNFEAERVGGQYVLTKIEKAK